MASRASTVSNLDSRALQAAAKAPPGQGEETAKGGSAKGGSSGASAGGDSALQLVPVRDLRPTQLAVGMYEVAYKRGRLVEKATKQAKLDEYLRSHAVPVVRGPGGALYLIDHHHLAAALAKNGVAQTYCTLRDDWSDVASETEFWERMERAGYLWLYDERGQQRQRQQLVAWLPQDVTGLRDDPFRSLAAFVRYAGGYEKSWTPFSEFRWANFLRTRLPLNAEPDSEQAVQVALQAAAHPDASHLPGYKGRRERAAGDRA